MNEEVVLLLHRNVHVLQFIQSHLTIVLLTKTLQTLSKDLWNSIMDCYNRLHGSFIISQYDQFSQFIFPIISPFAPWANQVSVSEALSLRNEGASPVPLWRELEGETHGYVLLALTVRPYLETSNELMSTSVINIDELNGGN